MSNFKFTAQFCALVFLCILITNGCKKDSPAASNTDQTGTPEAKFNPHTNYSVVNLVSDVTLPEYLASRTDANLVNAWGMAFGPTGGIWLSANETGVSVIYDKAGNILRAPVAI